MDWDVTVGVTSADIMLGVDLRSVTGIALLILAASTAAHDSVVVGLGGAAPVVGFDADVDIAVGDGGGGACSDTVLGIGAAADFVILAVVPDLGLVTGVALLILAASTAAHDNFSVGLALALTLLSAWNANADFDGGTRGIIFFLFGSRL